MRRPKEKQGPIDFVLFSTIMLLCAIGVVMVYSASSYSAFFTSGDSMLYLKKQLVSTAIGIVVMMAFIRYDYHKYKKYTGIIMLITIVLLLIVLACPARNGARRWIPLGPAGTLQPSEIAKYVVVLYMAKSMENKGEKIKSFLYGIMPYLLVSGFYAGLILLEKNLSIASVVMFVTLIVLFVAGAQMKLLFGIVAPLLGVLGSLFIYLEPYRLRRFLNFTNPWLDARGDGYQLAQSLLALGSGGIWGVGLGKSRQKCYYIPEPHNDFIFSIIGEELGLIGCVFIITLFLIFIWRTIKTAVNAKDVYGTLLAIGIGSVVAIQAIINVAVVTGSMPVTGVPLPFISYGGSSLIFNMAAMGILLNISRQSQVNF